MYNLSKHKIDDRRLLRTEMSIFNIDHHENGWHILVGDESIICPTVSDCIDSLKDGISELKKELLKSWTNLRDIANLIVHNQSINKGTFDNLIFLSAVKKSIVMSYRFPELKQVTDALIRLLDVDLSEVHENFISNFNASWIRIKVLHRLVMQELYKIKLLSRYEKTVKMAQVSGPWANLDLPMSERMWEWDEGETEYFGDRQKARRNQIRYNPEMDNNGFYYVWQDLSTHPYSFDDMKTDSPYKSRHLISQP